MSNDRVSLLLFDDGSSLASRLESAAAARGFRLHHARTASDVARALTRGCDVALVDLSVGAAQAVDAIRCMRADDADIEILVLPPDSASVAPALLSYELAPIGIVQRPFEIDHIFATIARALERRRMTQHNRRLVWELQTINDVADGIAHSLELSDVLTGALQRVTKAFSATGGSIRLRDPLTGEYEVHARVGPALLYEQWTNAGAAARRASDRVIDTRTAVIVEDFRALFPAGQLVPDLPTRSALSVPMLAGDELLGTVSIGAAEPHRFGVADQRLMAIVAGQVAVAVQNARLHDSVRRGKREWEQTFDAIGDPIAVFDSRGELLRGNRALADHLGWDVTQLRGGGCRDVGFCADDAVCSVARALSGEGSRAEITSADGRIFSVTTFPVGGRSGAASVVQVAKNVTEEIRSARRLQQLSDELSAANARSTAALERLKSTQAQLLQAEKLSAIGQLVAGVAHELNNPLTSVIGYAQLLEEEFRGPDAPDPRQVASDLRRIAEESERAARIVRNLLAFARRQTASRQPQDVADLFARVMSLRGYELRLNSIELETSFEAGLPPVVADGSQLQQALLNLVLNAEQALRHRTVRRLHVGARFDRAAGAVELFVSDTGHGIDEANLSKIFDPFFTTRDVGEGTGLGLSICYGIVRDHGGQILVETKVGVGTTFSLLLPARIDGSAQPDLILVAHADQGERDYLTAVLSGWGHQVVTAASGAEALRVCAEQRVHAMLVDRAVLGSDLAGWAETRAREQAVPLILVSMASDDGDVDRFGREQASAVLAPPFALRAVRSAVCAVTRECV